MEYLKMIGKRILFLILLYQICRSFFYAYNYSAFDPIEIESLPLILKGSLRFDLSAIMYTNVLFIAMFLLPFPFRANKAYQTTGKIIFVVVNSICVFANLADAAFFPFSMKRSSAALFLELKNEAQLLAAAWQFLVSYWFVAILFAVIVLALLKIYDRTKMPEKEDFSWRKVSIDTIILVLGFTLWLGFARGSFIPKDHPIYISMAADYVSSPPEMNIVLNTPISILTSWGNIKVDEKKFFSGPEECQKFYKDIHHYEPENKPPKNVVILIVESFSKEFIGALNKDIDGHESFSPFMDSLVGRSLYFEHTIANCRRSVEALPLVTASIPSPTEAYILTPYSGNKINSIASVLKKHGYHTSFLYGGHNGTFGFSLFAKMAQFDHIFGREEYSNEKDFDGTWGIFDEPMLQFWANNMNKFPQPFCSTMFTITTHYPFKIPEQYEGRFKTGSMDIHKCVGYTDNAIRKFFETASKMPWYKNTVFVITADHAFPTSAYEKFKNTMGVYSIPILFFTPDSSLIGYRDEMIQQSDIFPTLVDYLGFSDTIVAFGESVLEKNPHVVINCYGGLYQAFYKDFMLQYDEKKIAGLYKFKEDQMLKNNLVGQFPEEEQLILNKLKAFMQLYAYRVREGKMVEE